METKNGEMALFTRVEMPQMERRITTGDSMVFLGSCFAEHIGGRFLSYGLPALCNPLGVLYNPASIRAVVGASCRPLGAQEGSALPLFQTPDGEWRCWLADTGISAPTRPECEAKMNERLDILASGLTRSRHLFVTLGTAVCYRLRTTGAVVSNCHKMPGAMFEEHRLSTEECVAALSDVAERMQRLNPGLQVVFTVSPYRYRKYGFHGSQLSKATLLLAVDEVCRRFPASCLYLPVYEMFMDELRDYRFYAPDMLHPGEVAVDYVWQRLVAECMTERLQQYLSEYEPVRRGLAHRPSSPDSVAHRAFMAGLEQRRRELQSQYGI